MTNAKIQMQKNGSTNKVWPQFYIKKSAKTVYVFHVYVLGHFYAEVITNLVSLPIHKMLNL